MFEIPFHSSLSTYTWSWISFLGGGGNWCVNTYPWFFKNLSISLPSEWFTSIDNTLNKSVKHEHLIHIMLQLLTNWTMMLLMKYSIRVCATFSGKLWLSFFVIYTTILFIFTFIFTRSHGIVLRIGNSDPSTSNEK